MGTAPPLPSLPLFALQHFALVTEGAATRALRIWTYNQKNKQQKQNARRLHCHLAPSCPVDRGIMGTMNPIIPVTWTTGMAVVLPGVMGIVCWVMWECECPENLQS